MVVAQSLSAFALVCGSAEEEEEEKENREESGMILPGMYPGRKGKVLFGGEKGEEVVEGRCSYC